MSVLSFFNNIDTKSLVTNLALTILTVILSVSAVVYTARFTGPLPISVSQTTTQKDSSFSVTGESEITTIPDEARITAGIDISRPTVAAAQQEANRVTNAISQAVQSLGVKKEDIKTSNYSIYPDYDYNADQRRLLGYRVNANLEVRIKDLDLVNQVVDTMTAQGANQVGGVQFSLSTDKQDELTKQARQEAIADAKSNAQQLANLAGMKLGRIINVSETPLNSGIVPMMRMAEDSTAAYGGAVPQPTQIEPGSTSFKYTVTLSYETL